METTAKEKKNFKQIAIQFAKFTAFSLGAGIIQIVSFTVLHEALHLDYYIAYGISLVLSVLYNVPVNRKYTFKSTKNINLSILLSLLFYVFFAPYSLWLGDFLSDGALFYGGAGRGVNGILVTVIMMVQNFVLEFLWQRFLIFRKTIDSSINY
jgi:putative flippase GtrA